MGQWVKLSDFGDSYWIYQACELVGQWKEVWLKTELWTIFFPLDQNLPNHKDSSSYWTKIKISDNANDANDDDDN